jgi:hypothetical protein
MAKVRVYVHVHDADGRRHAALKPGDELPAWAVVTNPAVLGEAVEAAPAAAEAPAEAEKPKPARRTRKAAAPASE